MQQEQEYYGFEDKPLLLIAAKYFQLTDDPKICWFGGVEFSIFPTWRSKVCLLNQQKSSQIFWQIIIVELISCLFVKYQNI